MVEGKSMVMVQRHGDDGTICEHASTRALKNEVLPYCD